MYSEPWFRGFDGWWYSYVRQGGKRRQVKLVKGEDQREAAYDRWHELCRKPVNQPVVSTESVAGLLDVYLEWVQKNKKVGTYEIYAHHIQTFCLHVGPDLTVGELRPKHVTGWLGKFKWSDSTKAGAAQTVRTAFHWLVREGHCEKNPVGHTDGGATLARNYQHLAKLPKYMQDAARKAVQ